jgi:hypothetical protein
MSAAGQQQTPNDKRNWKLLVDPLLKKGLPKLYRFDGHCPPGHGVGSFDLPLETSRISVFFSEFGFHCDVSNRPADSHPSVLRPKRTMRSVASFIESEWKRLKKLHNCSLNALDSPLFLYFSVLGTGA